MAVLPTGIGPVTGGYQIERSLRFNSADSAYLNRTPGSASNRRTWSWSGWVKRGALGSAIYPYLITAYDSSGARETYFNIEGDCLRFAVDNTSSGNIYLIQTTQVFRDPSAWYHIMVVLDTTQATTSNRLKMYVNGTQITAFSTANYPAQNYDATINLNVIHNIGRSARAAAYYYDGYMTEVNFIDGQALTPSDFGETDTNTGVWKPKAFSGTYGTNGFYLKFADNSNTTAATLGKDSSGNGNNWTPNNFSVTAGSGNDSLVDTPTSYGTDTGVGGTVRGNYATLNPVWKNLYPGVYANGNLDFSTSTAKYGNAFSTIGLTSGKWYVEVLVSGTIGSALKLGVSNQTTLNYLVGTEDDITPTTGVGYAYFLTNGNKSTNATNSAYGNSVASGDIVGIILDLDNGKIWFSKNGTVQASGDPVAGTNAAFTGITASSVWFFGGTTYATQASFVFNFGQRAFAYTAPSGFKALCTQNLPTPTIGATSTTQANDYFNPILWTGDGTNPRSFTGVGFQPDLVWIKSRSNAYGHRLADAVRGVGKELFSNATDAEVTNNNNGSVQAFNSDGFTLSGSTSTSDVNGSGLTFVAWNWNAGGSNATNTAGTITSTVRANTTSGFSIVTYTGTGSNATVGHGLGVAPSMIIVKNRGAVTDWLIYHTSLGATKSIAFDTAAAITSSTRWNDTAPSSTLITLGTSSGVNGSTNTYVAYAFAPVAGYSAFGSYTGNGSTDGPFVYTGFRPRFVIVKRTSGIEKWYMMDTARDIDNPIDITQLVANASDAEATFTAFDFTSNGFKNRTSNVMSNGSGDTYIYMAFAEAPFKYSLAR
jgi:hypothetical protein